MNKVLSLLIIGLFLSNLMAGTTSFLIKLPKSPQSYSNHELEALLNSNKFKILKGKSELVKVSKIFDSLAEQKIWINTLKEQFGALYVVKNKKLIHRKQKVVRFSHEVPFPNLLNLPPLSYFAPVNDPAYPKQWAMKNTGQPRLSGVKGTPGIDINIEKAWEITKGSSDILVAIIDTGINYHDPDLKDNIWVNIEEQNGAPGIDDDNNGYVDDIYGYDFSKEVAEPMDNHGHGTHIAGVIGAKGDNSLGIAGINSHIKMMALKWLDQDNEGYISAAIQGIDYAIEKGARIINCSWGYEDDDETEDYEVTPLREAIERAKAAHILIVAAAGNEGTTNDEAGFYPASYKLNNVISVAAINNEGNLVTWSNHEHPNYPFGSSYGANSVDIAAPGHEVLSNTMNGLESWSGTSMAAPHVTGIAALLLAQDSTLLPDEIKRRIVNGARPRYSLRKFLKKGAIADAYYALTNQTAPKDPDDPHNWQRLPYELSTPHKYPANWEKTYTIKVENAKRMAVHFSRFSFESRDYVLFYNGEGELIAKQSRRIKNDFSPIVPGNTMILKVVSDDNFEMYGFDIDGIAVELH